MRSESVSGQLLQGSIFRLCALSCSLAQAQPNSADRTSVLQQGFETPQPRPDALIQAAQFTT